MNAVSETNQTLEDRSGWGEGCQGHAQGIYSLWPKWYRIVAGNERLFYILWRKISCLSDSNGETMREYTVRFWASGEDLYSFSEEFAEQPELERKYIHRMEILADGSATVLHECHGPPEAVEAALEDSERIHDVIATGDENTVFYAHFEPDPVTRQMIEGRRDTSITLKMPLELRTDGSLVGRFVGDQSALSQAFELLPDGVEAELLRMQGDMSDSLTPSQMLTARQREVLRLAVERGYYEDPREVTQEDLAAELDISTATVGEHLRKIESAVLGSLDV